MIYISVKHLKAVDACGDQVSKFKEIFGDSVEFNSLEEAKNLAKKYSQDFDFVFIGYAVFGQAYGEARAPLCKAYEEAEAPLWKAYEEAEAPLLKAYEEARAPLCKAYEEAEAPLLKAYKEAEAPLREAYEEARAQLFAEMWWNKGE